MPNMPKNNVVITSLNEVNIPSPLPPIMITCFTRPDLLEEVLAGIEKQTLLPEKILAFVDGPRQERDSVLLLECIKLLEEFSQQIEVEIVPRKQNLGCDLNTIGAFTEVLAKYPSVVYLEDDVVPNIYFYDRLCRLLEVYKDVKQIFSVNGYDASTSEMGERMEEDFMISHRFFSWGFATWADRWYSLDIDKIKQSYNPFGRFYHIPLNVQTKLTMVNQFYLEKTGKTDWVITVTLATLDRGYVHVTPMVSMVKNIGFGHPESETYRGGEPKWVNCAYDVSANPDKLPTQIETMDKLKKPLTDLEVIDFLRKKNLYLKGNEAWDLFFKYDSWMFKFLLFKLFVSQQIKRRFN
jgi:hypothetical protein